jgi:hypothetical protein
MKPRLVAVPLLLALAVGGFLVGTASRSRAQDPVVVTSWEYLHLLIPLDRNLGTYRKNDARILDALQNAGAEGWELVSANEPANSFMVEGRASVEFFLKRPRR